MPPQTKSADPRRDDDSCRTAGAELLAWYDRHARVLPWRARHGAAPDPYRVWLSEIMLQQTTVAAVVPYFHAFLARWPTVDALARAPLEDVLAAWAGLGYYARARNLHRCARVVADELGGRFPRTEEALRRLPGVGPYTAAAIAAIAFGRRAVVVDGNVERVMARMFAVDTPLPRARPRLRAAAETLTPAERAGDYAQAVMDLGATICTPRSPRCLMCPWSGRCAARRRGAAERFPVRAARTAKPRRRGIAFVLTRADGAVWLRPRPADGLLGGMLEVPSTAWREALPDTAAALQAAPVEADWRPVAGTVAHGFTHFDLQLAVWRAAVERTQPRGDGGRWVTPDALAAAAVPTLIRKVIRHALAAPAGPRRPARRAKIKPKETRPPQA
jgi:A/G-specific adenine glycosylase